MGVSRLFPIFAPPPARASPAAVDYIDLCNLATLNEVMQGSLLDAIAVKLMRIGAGLTLDYADAPAFFAELQSAIEAGLRRTRH